MGGLGDDTLDGRWGGDKLGGGRGRNAMTGGTSHDTFRIVSADRYPQNDYNPDEDMLTIVSRKDKSDASDGPAV